MDDEERTITADAITAMYKAAKLKPPHRSKIIFVPSPFAMRFAGGFATALYELGRKAPKSGDSYMVCGTAREAVLALTGIKAPTTEGQYSSSRESWYCCTENYLELAKACSKTKDEAKRLLSTAEEAYSMVNGGNQWSAWVSYLSFFRHIARLGESHGIDYSNWDHYEQAAIHSGPRLMHAEFCIVSDRPMLLSLDDQNRQHADNGPFMQWRDGSALYCWEGTRMPRWVMEEQVTIKAIQNETNTEIQRALISRYGPAQYMFDCGAEVVDMDALSIPGSAPRALMRDRSGNMWLTVTDGSTARVYTLSAPRAAKTCAEAHLALCGFDESRIKAEC